MAPVVTTGGLYSCSKKKNLTTFLGSCISSLRLSMLFFSVSFQKIRIVNTGDSTAFLTRHPCTGDHANLLWIIQRKKPSNYACHPCAGVMLIFSEGELSVSSLRRCHSKKNHCVLQTNDYISRIVRVILVPGPCNLRCSKGKKTTLLELYLSALCRDHSNLLSAEDKNLTRLLREIRTFGRAVEGSNVSLLTNAVGGLSGGRRGGDTSSAITAPSFVGARPRVGPWALVFAPGTCCPPFFMRRAYANDVPAHPGARDQPCAD